MIEIEVFQYDPPSGLHKLKLYHGKKLVYENDLCTEFQLIELREYLYDEIKWLEDYIMAKVFDKSP